MTWTMDPPLEDIDGIPQAPLVEPEVNEFLEVVRQIITEVDYAKQGYTKLQTADVVPTYLVRFHKGDRFLEHYYNAAQEVFGEFVTVNDKKWYQVFREWPVW